MPTESIIRIYNRAQDHMTDSKLRREDGRYIIGFYKGLQDACKLVVTFFGGELKLKKNHLAGITKMTPPVNFEHLVDQYNESFEKAEKISSSLDLEKSGDGYYRGYSHNILQVMDYLGYAPTFKSDITLKNLIGFRRKK